MILMRCETLQTVLRMAAMKKAKLKAPKIAAKRGAKNARRKGREWRVPEIPSGPTDFDLWLAAKPEDERARLTALPFEEQFDLFNKEEDAKYTPEELAAFEEEFG